MSFKMKYQITPVYLTAPSKRRSGIKMPGVKFIVAHDTGNPRSTARNNVNYYERSRNEMSASAHIFVDDKEILECIPALTGAPEKAWHVLYNVTKDNELYGCNANDYAIGVEYCYGSNINANEAYKRYVWVLAYICYKFNLNPAKDIVGHFILDPQRKTDPASGLKASGRTYEQLLKDVVTEYNECLGKNAETYKVYQYNTFLKEFNDLDEAITYAKLWDHSSVRKINEEWVWDNYPKQAPVNVGTVKAKIEWNLPNVILKRGSKGNAVKQLQTALNALNFKCGTVDGIFGAKTEDAVKRFQSVYCNPADGIYGPKTRQAMLNQLNK